MKRSIPIILLCAVCLLCSCGGQKKPETYGGEYVVVGTVTCLDEPYILMEVNADTEKLQKEKRWH